MFSNFIMFFPEISLALISMLMQVVAVFCERSIKKVLLVTILLCGGVLSFLLFSSAEYEYYEGSFLTSSIIDLFKAVVLGLTLMNILIYRDFVKISKKSIKMEYVTIMLLSTLGIFISISARDFLLLFCGLELQALSGYALTAFNTRDENSSEAGLKYFILGALMSGLMLLGISFLYGFSGSINFLEIKALMNEKPTLGLVVGGALVLASLLFKLSAAPFHIWTPDVYEGAPVVTTSYFATAQKIGLLIVFINFMDGVIDDYYELSQKALEIVAVISMIIGSLGAIGQKSLKRLMAYSSILNMGYVLMSLSLHSIEGNNSGYIYMLIYSISTVGFFACLVGLLGERANGATFDDLKGSSINRKALSASIAVFMFSMIGLPPFAGFFGKYYIFIHVMQKDGFILIGVAAISTLIASFYYLKIVKYLYFMRSQEDVKRIPTKKGLWLVTTISVTFTIFFLVFAHKYIV
ncbi:MAG: hypothetical protein DGJ47_000117 [Rickettsiaceae bacterium]